MNDINLTISPNLQIDLDAMQMAIFYPSYLGLMAHVLARSKSKIVGNNANSYQLNAACLFFLHKPEVKKKKRHN